MTTGNVAIRLGPKATTFTSKDIIEPVKPLSQLPKDIQRIQKNLKWNLSIKMLIHIRNTHGNVTRVMPRVPTDEGQFVKNLWIVSRRSFDHEKEASPLQIITKGKIAPYTPRVMVTPSIYVLIKYEQILRPINGIILVALAVRGSGYMSLIWVWACLGSHHDHDLLWHNTQCPWELIDERRMLLRVVRSGSVDEVKWMSLRRGLRIRVMLCQWGRR